MRFLSPHPLSLSAGVVARIVLATVLTAALAVAVTWAMIA